MKKLLFLLFFTTFLVQVKAQLKSDTWRFNFSVHDESIHDKNVPSPIPGFGEDFRHAHYSGWTIGIERTLLRKRNVEFSLGLNYSRKTHVFSKSNLSFPLSIENGHAGRHHHFLSIPARITYTKHKTIRPFLSIETGFKIGETGPRPKWTNASRPLGVNYLSINPGVEIAINPNILLTLSMANSFNNIFNNSHTKFSSGFRIGLRIKF